jgi:N6-adenosine-specific RNA methylase IME4
LENRDLILIDQARHALAEARSLSDFSEIRDRAMAYAYYLSRKTGAEEAARYATEIGLRAERCIGEKLGADPAIRRGGSKSRGTTLPEGISKDQSSHYQKLAALPVELFEAEVVKPGASTKGLVEIARCREREAQREALRSSESSTCTVQQLEVLVERELKFGTIYADPPWKYSNQGTRAATDKHYETMGVAEIAALPIEKLAASRAHLHLWTTNAFLRDAFDVLEAWGFNYKGVFVWVKPDMGIGNYWRVSHEFMLLGTRGGCPFLDRSQMSWIHHPRTQHSLKPDKVRQLIELVSPAPRLELFGRQVVEGWLIWGDEIEANMFQGKVEEIT